MEVCRITDASYHHRTELPSMVKCWPGQTGNLGAPAGQSPALAVSPAALPVQVHGDNASCHDPNHFLQVWTLNSPSDGQAGAATHANASADESDEDGVSIHAKHVSPPLCRYIGEAGINGPTPSARSSSQRRSWRC